MEGTFYVIWPVASLRMMADGYAPGYASPRKGDPTRNIVTTSPVLLTAMPPTSPPNSSPAVPDCSTNSSAPVSPSNRARKASLRPSHTTNFLLKDVTIPAGATHLLIYAANDVGESTSASSFSIVDRVIFTADLNSTTHFLNSGNMSFRGTLDQVTLEFTPDVVVDISNDSGGPVPIHNSKILVDGSTDKPFKISVTGANGAWNRGGSDSPSLISSTAMSTFLDSDAMSYYFSSPGVTGMDSIPNNSTPFDMKIDCTYFNSQYIFASSSNDKIEVLGSSSGFGNSAIYLLDGNDDVKLGVVYKVYVHGGRGNDLIKYPGVWELRVWGQDDDDILLSNQNIFAASNTAPLTPNNMDIRGGDGNDHITFALLTGDSSATVANFSNTNTFDGDAGNDIMVIGDAAFSGGSVTNVNGGAGNDSVLFKPRSISMPGTFNLSGGAGIDRLFFHVDIPSTPTTFFANLSSSVVASSWEIIDMGAIVARHGRGNTDTFSRNNSSIVTLNLTANQAIELASGNEYGGGILYIVGDTDGTDRIDLTAYTRNNPDNESGYVAFLDVGIKILVKLGLSVSIDGGANFVPLQ